MTTKTAIKHYFEPERMAKTYGNTGPCCSRPADEHPAFPSGDVTIVLKRDVRTLTTVIPKGTRLAATAVTYETMREDKPARWGKNVLGQFAELERAVISTVTMPSWDIRGPGEDHLTAIPVRWAELAR